MNQTITSLIVQIKVDIAAAVAAMKDFATGSKDSIKEVDEAGKNATVSLTDLSDAAKDSGEATAAIAPAAAKASAALKEAENSATKNADALAEVESTSVDVAAATKAVEIGAQKTAIALKEIDESAAVASSGLSNVQPAAVGVSKSVKVIEEPVVATTGSLDKMGKSAGKVTEQLGHSEKNAFKARMGFMELEHTARSTMDILLMGGSPRMLLAQIPQMVQGATMLGLSMSTLLPIIGGVGAALGAGYWLWSEWTAGERKAAEEAKNLQEAWKGLIPLLKEINTQQKAGLLGASAAGEYEDYLTGKKKLYRNYEGQLTPNATQKVDRPIFRTLPGGATAQIGTESVNENLPQASMAEIQKWVQDQITANGQLTNDQAQAIAHLHELEKTAADEALSDLEKQKASIREKYEKQRQEIELTAKAAGAQLGNINFSSDAKVQAAQKAIAQTKIAEANAIAEAEQKAAEQTAQKKMAEEQKAAAEYQKQWTQANKDLDAQLDLQAAEAGKKRTDFYAQEYLQRQALALKFFITGKLSEDQYADAARQAQIKMLDGQAAYNRELQRTQQLQQELTRTQIEAQLHAVQTNPFLTDNQKAAQSVPLIQASLTANASSIAGYQHTANSTQDEAARIEALTKVNELTLRQIDLQNQLAAAQGRSSFGYQFKATLTDIQNQWGTWAIQTAGTFKSVFNSAIGTISNGITGLIMGTKTWGQAIKEIGTSLVTDVVQGIVQMGVRWVATQILMATMGKALAASSVAATAPFAAAQAVIWSAPATLATIATMGEAALQAPGIIGLAQALTLSTSLAGFATGGAVDGPGTSTSDSILARLSKGEFVIPAAKVNEFGTPFFEAIRTGSLRAQDLVPSTRGNLSGGMRAAGGNGPVNVQAQSRVILVNSRSEMLDAMRSAEGEQITVAHVRKNRLKAGIPT